MLESNLWVLSRGANHYTCATANHHCANKGCKREVNFVCLDYIGHQIYVDNAILTMLNFSPNRVWVSDLEMW